MLFIGVSGMINFHRLSVGSEKHAQFHKHGIIYNRNLVPGVGLEPTRYCYRWILNPLRLPISPPGLCLFSRTMLRH